MTTRRTTLRAIGLTAAVVAAGLVSGAPAHAVTSAQPATSSTYSFAAKLQIGAIADGGVACSGSLVHARWVLTAASCFGAAVTAGAPARATTVTVGRPDLTQPTGHALNAVELVPHPDRDVVLVRLAAEVPAALRPIALAATAPAVGDQLTVTGFGRTADTWVPDALHAAAFTVTAVGATALDVTAANGASTCKGDAGGAALAGGRLAAVNGPSWQNGCLGAPETTREGAQETRVDGLQAWVDAQTTPRGTIEHLKNDVTKYCLGVNGASKAVGAAVVQWYCNGQGDHRWVQRATTGGFMELYNTHSGLCASVGTATTNSTPITQRACGGTGEQWTAEVRGASVRYKNRHSGLCLAIPASSTEPGKAAVQYACDQADGSPRGDQLYQARSHALGSHLKNNHSLLCLAIGSGATADGVQAIQYTCSDNDDQRWLSAPTTGGAIELRNLKSKKCLGVNNSTTNGTAVAQYTCDGGNDQKWKVENQDTNGVKLVRYRNVHSDRCIAVPSASKEKSAKIIQWPCLNNADHKWVP
ncbi:ricin-type beta-trefoil lectin domain protein [Spirilliplanes yamanashiensis]|uniref:Peptidase S1 domain-containing protein n=1 Tax=Spirilliplanes yamanashiensis TaxID=42233 RepID=A0A8J3Y942_9ACTN|nr:ricin-type beta-trefoil lectin domain protein [Spirilliplanes yamanashiensis]MDP9815354.1 hypothetical protein [Spirilliplanes yamanashiensis]GIJ03609.1 hypothetical protein Sya03_29610 [Spirilliplanes yamanashiensis]